MSTTRIKLFEDFRKDSSVKNIYLDTKNNPEASKKLILEWQLESTAGNGGGSPQTYKEGAEKAFDVYKQVLKNGGQPPQQGGKGGKGGQDGQQQIPIEDQNGQDNQGDKNQNDNNIPGLDSVPNPNNANGSNKGSDYDKGYQQAQKDYKDGKLDLNGNDQSGKQGGQQGQQGQSGQQGSQSGSQSSSQSGQQGSQSGQGQQGSQSGQQGQGQSGAYQQGYNDAIKHIKNSLANGDSNKDSDSNFGDDIISTAEKRLIGGHLMSTEDLRKVVSGERQFQKVSSTGGQDGGDLQRKEFNDNILSASAGADELIISKVLKNLKDIGKDSVANILKKKSLINKTKPVKDWKKELARYLGNAFEHTRDFEIKSGHRHFLESPFVMPYMDDYTDDTPRIDLYFFVDVSGSVSKQQHWGFLVTIYQIAENALKTNDLEGDITIVPFDSSIDMKNVIKCKTADDVLAIKELKVVEGGTQWEPIVKYFNHIEKEDKRHTPKHIIVLTDGGFFEYPDLKLFGAAQKLLNKKVLFIVWDNREFRCSFAAKTTGNQDAIYVSSQDLFGVSL